MKKHVACILFLTIFLFVCGVNAFAGHDAELSVGNYVTFGRYPSQLKAGLTPLLSGWCWLAMQTRRF